MSIDLHCHTRFSDGSVPMPDVVEMASLRGIHILAITDHDTMVGCAAAAELGDQRGVRVIPAVEISCFDNKRGRKVHILCYAPLHPEYIEPIISKTAANRHAATLRSIEKVIQLYPIPREMIFHRAEGSEIIYKQHIMQTLMDAGYADEMFGALFRKLFNSRDGLAFERFEYPDVYEVLCAVHKAEGKAVLAHPSEYNSMKLLQELAEQQLLHGVEINYPRNKKEEKAVMREIAARYHLAVTGGTDFHGFYSTRKNPIGTCTTEQTEFDKLFNKKEGNTI